MQAKNIFLGLFTTIYRSPPRLGQGTEQAKGCPGSQPARKCSILTFQLICWLCINRTFEEQRKHSFQHHLAKAPEEEHNWSMKFSGHSLLPMKNQYLGLREGNLGLQQCWQRTAKTCWGAQLGAGTQLFGTGQTRAQLKVRAAFFSWTTTWHRCLCRQRSIIRWKHHQVPAASKSFFRGQKHLSSLYRTSSNSAFPSKECLSFLGGYVTLLKSLLKGKDRATVQRETETPAQTEKAH